MNGDGTRAGVVSSAISIWRTKKLACRNAAIQSPLPWFILAFLFVSFKFVALEDHP